MSKNHPLRWRLPRSWKRFPRLPAVKTGCFLHHWFVPSLHSSGPRVEIQALAKGTTRVTGLSISALYSTRSASYMLASDVHPLRCMMGFLMGGSLPCDSFWQGCNVVNRLVFYTDHAACAMAVALAALNRHSNDHTRALVHTILVGSNGNPKQGVSSGMTCIEGEKERERER